MATKLFYLMGPDGDSGRHYCQGPVLPGYVACGLDGVPCFEGTGPQVTGTFRG